MSRFVVPQGVTPKILIIYMYYETADALRNLSFFCRHGVTPYRDRQHVIVINGECSIEDQLPTFENVTVLKRENEGFDFGAWAQALRSVDVEPFDYVIFLNSSVIGPFLPSYQDSSRWPDLFTALINERVKLGGLTINVLQGEPHVQSMLLVTDRVGLRLLIDGGLFMNNGGDRSKEEVIFRRELRASKIILDAGYDVDCLAVTHHRRARGPLQRNTSGDIVYPGAYLMGHTIEPIDCVFFKTNRGCSTGSLVRSMQLADYKRSTSADRCFQDPRILRAINVLKRVPSAWKGHLELAIWLTCRFLPQIVVDLGVDYGVSTYAWGVSGLSQVIGIDWFQGDAHAGHRDTYADVLALGTELTKQCGSESTVRIWKSSFEDAADALDRQVDILHLDGLHTYEAVQQDLKSWLPKLSKTGLLVMHDVRSFPDSVGKVFAALPYHKIILDHSAGLGFDSRPLVDEGIQSQRALKKSQPH